MGILFSVDYYKLSNGKVKDPHQAAQSSFIVAGIYAAFLVGCSFRVLQLNKKSKKQDTFVFDNE